MRSRVLCLALLAALTACGADGDPGAEGTPTSTGSPSSSESPTTCTTFTPPTSGVQADLDGDGEKELFALVDEGACQLLVGPDGTTPLETERLALSPYSGIRVVTLQGTDRQLLLLSGEDQPRGGFQPYLVGAADGVIGLVTFQGDPLLPFAATDGGEAPSSASCNANGGIDLSQAEVSGPVGITPTWTVATTSYELDGNLASPVAQTTEEDVPDGTLREERPELFAPELLLGDCAS
ncbi:MAG TPA: hypothetical protein VFK41_04155 [Nocardioidaceae bacterium]|nr:hypothetical protein [Nocardioidaceae bacterium]